MWQLESISISETGPLSRDFGLRDQMRRSAVSAVSNIAEGDERSTDKESIRFFYMSKGSLAELRTQIQIACEVNVLSSDIYESLDSECSALAKMIGSLNKARSIPLAPSL